MWRVLWLLFVLAVFARPMSAQEPLSKDDVQAAIDSGKAKAKKKCKDIGLWLTDVLPDHAIQVYTPRAWVEHQSCEAALDNRDVSLTEADAQPVLRVYVLPWSVRKQLRSTNSPCPSLRTVALADGARMNLLRPQSEEKQAAFTLSRADYLLPLPAKCEMIVATFSLSDVAALRALTPDAEFHVYVMDDTMFQLVQVPYLTSPLVQKGPLTRMWRVHVKQFKKLP
jgi:hypothetical protein